MNKEAHSLRTHRAGFTLVELLVTISIVAIIASMVMFAMFSAQEASRVSKTRSTVAKLDSIIREKWESYYGRRVPITVPATATPRQAAMLRLNALREMMRMEMPERWDDIVKFNAGTFAANGPISGIAAPSLWQAYVQKFNALHTMDSTKPTLQYQGAECLYLIVTTGASDDGGRQSFGESEISDIDNDGMPEFKDAWGNPISFLRWPSAFNSELQVFEPFQDGDSDGVFDTGETYTDWNNNGTRDMSTKADPFDPMQVYPLPAAPRNRPTFAIYPLIYSAGPDRIFDINSMPDSIDYADATVANDPFYFQVGVQEDTGAGGDPNGRLDFQDNIHNHLMGTR